MKMNEVHFFKNEKGWSCQLCFTYISRDVEFPNKFGVITSAVYRWWFSAWCNAKISLKTFLSINEVR